MGKDAIAQTWKCSARPWGVHPSRLRLARQFELGMGHRLPPTSSSPSTISGPPPSEPSSRTAGSCQSSMLSSYRQMLSSPPSSTPSNSSWDFVVTTQDLCETTSWSADSTTNRASKPPPASRIRRKRSAHQLLHHFKGPFGKLEKEGDDVERVGALIDALPALPLQVVHEFQSMPPRGRN